MKRRSFLGGLLSLPIIGGATTEIQGEPPSHERLAYEEALKVLKSPTAVYMTTSSSMVGNGSSYDDWKQRREAEQIVARYRTCVSCKWLRSGDKCAHPSTMTRRFRVTGKESDRWAYAEVERFDPIACSWLGSHWEPK
jgi:hypothetical protein